MDYFYLQHLQGWFALVYSIGLLYHAYRLTSAASNKETIMLNAPQRKISIVYSAPDPMTSHRFQSPLG
jgi:hypothetical protein